MARQPARLPIQLVVDNWNQRANEAKAAGIPDSVIRTIGQEDINRVKQGYTAMTKDQAQVSVLGALGKGPIKSTPPTGIKNLPGNAVKDISGIIRSLPRIPGRLVNDVIHFTDHPGQSVRDLAPIATAFIPYVGPQISASILAAEGAENIAKNPQSVMTNPVSTALAFLPAVGIAGKYAGKAGALGEVGTGAVKGIAGAKEALAAGHPVKALGRATGVATAKEEALGKLGLSTPQRGVYAAESLYKRNTFGEKLVADALDPDSMVMGPGQAALVDKALGPMAERQSVLVDKAMKQYKVDRPTALQIVGRERLPFNPTDYFPYYEGKYAAPKGMSLPDDIGTIAKLDDPYLIPKDVAAAIDNVFSEKPVKNTQMAAFGRINEKYITGPLRKLLLRGPRHNVHVGVGNTVFGSLAEPTMPLYLAKAFNIWRKGGMEDSKFAGIRHSTEKNMGYEKPVPLSGEQAALDAELRSLHSQHDKAVGSHKVELQTRIDAAESRMIDKNYLLPDMRTPPESPSILSKLKSPETMTPDQLWWTATGSALSRLLKEFYARGTGTIQGKGSPNSIRGLAAHPVQALDRFEAAINDITRGAHFLALESKGVTPEQILAASQKAFVSADALSPFERVILKQVYPFYTFQAHLLKYLKNYPADHPIRASIISGLARQEQEEWDTGLPTHLMNLFYIGKPDADGNTQTVDIKSFNPFRSMYNGYTLAGFTQGLHPALSAGLKSMGVNIFSASPDLHSEITVNPDTGHLENKRSEVANNLLTSILPPIAGIQGAFGLTKDLRRMRENDPEAWKRFMFSSFNIPLAVSKVNTASDKAEYQRNKLAVVQSDVSKALRTGDVSYLKKYHGSVVPFQGKLIDPVLLEELLRKLAPVSEKTDISPKSLITRSR